MDMRQVLRLAGVLSGVSIHGTAPWESRYVLDGLSTSDPVWGGNALPLSVELIDDVQVRTGGLPAEYGRATGGLLEVRSRRFTHEAFHGTAGARYAF